MKITWATPAELAYLQVHDPHIPPDALPGKIERGEILLLWEDSAPIGWLRFNYFWDEIPFMNLLWIESPNRGKGLGKALVEAWQGEMRQRGFKRVMTSTLSNESAQHFYRRLGYRDCGALLLPGEPLEIFLIKEL